jgi:hypothetical protein
MAIRVTSAFMGLVLFTCLCPVSVAAEAENRSKNRAYQTGSGETTKAPFSISGFAGNGLQYTRCHATRHLRATSWILRYNLYDAVGNYMSDKVLTLRALVKTHLGLTGDNARRSFT